MRPVDADAVLHRHRQGYRVLHGLDAVGHQVRLGHQAGPDGAALHALAGAPAIQVDLVVTPLRRQPRAMRQVRLVAAAQLQSDAVLLAAEVQVPRDITMQQCTGGHHLGVQPGAARDEAVKEAAMAVRPIHHEGDGEAPRFSRLYCLHSFC